jgi:hypothetical protein
MNRAHLVISMSALVAFGCGGARAAAPDGSVGPEPVFEAQAVGPLTNGTALQIVSVFSYEPGEELISPATEIAGFVTDARVKQGFGKEPLVTMFVEPTPSSIKAKRLLVMAWGPRAEFSLGRAKTMGQAAMKEALKAGVADAAYAPIVRDQGVTSIPADEVAAAFIEGALGEYLAEQRAEPTRAFALKRFTYEAGPAFVGAVTKATARGVLAAHHVAP